MTSTDAGPTSPTPPVELQWPAAGVRATMRVVAPSLCVVAASPSHLEAVGVEPQTHAPQGLRRLLDGEPGALSMLAPGEALALTVDLSFERIDNPARGLAAD